MENRRRRWLWLLVPILAIVAPFVLNSGDEFTRLARGGTEIELRSVTDRGRPLGNGSEIVPPTSPGWRARIWRVPRRFEALSTELGAQGFSVRGGAANIEGWGDKDVVVRRQSQFGRDADETRVTLIDGTDFLRDGSTILAVQEPTGLAASWRRLVRRFGR